MSAINSSRNKYRNDYLKQVIVRIDFDFDLPFSQNSPDERIYECVKKRFPMKEANELVGKELMISPEATTTQEFKIKEWHYLDVKNTKRLILTSKYLSIVYSKYEKYEALRDDFLSVLNALYTSYPKLQVNRLGLRYIDVIDLPMKSLNDLNKYFIPTLCSIFTIADDEKTIARAFHVLEFNYGEDFLRFQFGVLNPDFPATIKNREYTLDFDIYTSRLLDKADIETSLDNFHNKINESFEQVITDELRNKMKLIKP